jgi:peptide/nickel transport system permease protein
MRLRTFILLRILLTIPMILILVTLVFGIMHVLPGDPVLAVLGSRQATQQEIDALRHQLGLDKPLHLQYLDYIGGLLTGNLGYSMTRQDPVTTELAIHLPGTISLTFWSMLLAIPLGIYGGVFAAKKGGKIDASIRIGALVRWCIPVFWFGLALQIIVVQFNLPLPIAGQASPRIVGVPTITGLYVVDAILARHPQAVLDAFIHLLLPVLTLGTTMAASITQISRTNVVDVLGEEYIKIAGLKGLTDEEVFQRHALPNALIPILTYTGLQVAILLTGAVLTETVFSWPGLGRLLIDAVGYRDFNLVQGCIVLFAFVVSIVNLIVDISYAIVDPRVRF